jgi:CRP-like cAMP-binding protein
MIAMSLLSAFRKHIENVAGLTNEAWDDLEQIITVTRFKSGSLYLEAGSKTVNEAFLLEGILRGFYLSYEGTEINVSFFQDGSVLPPHHIRTKNHMSLLNLEALSDAVMAEFDADVFTSLRYKHPCLMKYGNAVVEQELDYKTGREIFLLTKNAEEKYMTFREIYPGLENQIPQYHIASYLGITPVSLSRIRKNLARR